ncbi:MAG: DUF349 domain-containing protein [Bacteroidia bacterium]
MNPSNSENYHAQLNEAEELLNAQTEPSTSNRFSKLTKNEIIVEAEKLIQTADVKSAYDTLLDLKDSFEKITQSERSDQIKVWVDAGNDAKDFVPSSDDLKSKLLDVFNRFNELREDEKRRAEQEKLQNLKKKETVLEKIKTLVNAEETENTLSEMRDLMREWKEIRTIPKEHQEKIASEYKILVEQYYDNLSIYNELKDLDREKNLELKIELIKKVELLNNENNSRKVWVSLNKLHEDWKNTGPVRNEISEEIWSRFKSASDEIITKVKSVREAQDQERLENLDKKLLLIEKAANLTSLLPSQIRDWQKMGNDLDEIFNQWKKIGPVPHEKNEEVWSNFQEIRNHFYTERKQFFKDFNNSKQDNLEKKTKLCEQAEALKDEQEFKSTAEKLQKLQDEWKSIGPVPEEYNETIWRRFRDSFDYFYDRRNKWYEERKKAESGSVENRESILKELETLVNTEYTFSQLKEIQNKWNSSGFVSGKKYHSLNNKYKKIIDPLFQKLRDEMNQNRKDSIKEYVNTISSAKDGDKKLNIEERKLKDQIGKINDEIVTIENNKSFFQHAKNAEAVLKQFDAKIHKLQQQKDRLTGELKIFQTANK